MEIKATRAENRLVLPWEEEGQFWQLNQALEFADSRLADSRFSLSGCSCRVDFTFTLDSRFYSGRDRAGKEKKPGETNSVQNNRLCREWISGFPLAKASGWKRLFRKIWSDNGNDAAELERLFGVSEEEELEDQQKTKGQGSCKGELKFRHALFADVTSGETYLIAPRDQQSGRVDRNIIEYEVVPVAKSCRLVVDYLPKNPDASAAVTIIVRLLQAAARSTQEVIGGKNSVNFGLVRLFRAEVVAGPGFPEGLEDLACSGAGLGDAQLIIDRHGCGQRKRKQ
ncbi:MAG: hypothetical protein DRH04_01995 [Deltaproteobacteria bacterium]|nr:MAG: hypothetical protein DRH04_01995 [Deltaproteobacteria bacterium]